MEGKCMTCQRVVQIEEWRQKLPSALRVTGELAWLESRLPDKKRLKDSTWS